MTEYMAVWLVYDTKKIIVKKCMTQYLASCKTQNVGAIFWQKKAKKGCMTQKCMTQNVRPTL